MSDGGAGREHLEGVALGVDEAALEVGAVSLEHQRHQPLPPHAPSALHLRSLPSQTRSTKVCAGLSSHPPVGADRLGPDPEPLPMNPDSSWRDPARRKRPNPEPLTPSGHTKS
eukprot:829353-Rhodomonas_salina.1